MSRPRSMHVILGYFLTSLLLSLVAFRPAAATQREIPESSPAAVNTTDVGPRFLIRPFDGADGDYFTVEAEAGTSHTLTVLLGNADDEELKLRTYVANTLPIVNGGFAIASEVTEDQTPTGTAAWIDYPAETFTFAPGEGVERTFTVDVPEGTEPGQYIAGLALETAEPLAVEGTDLFDQVIRKTIAVFIIVPGPEEPAFQLGEPELVTEGGLTRILVPIDNTGNVLVKPEGDLSLTDESGETVLRAPLAMGSVYAGTTVDLSVALTTTLPDGTYSLSVDLTDDETNASATLEDAPIAFSAAEQAPAQFILAGDVTLAPDSANPAFANVDLTITNQGEPVPSAEVLLDVMRDGEAVETFSLAPLFSLPAGDTTIAQRYVPPTGWEPGSWTFEVRLNIIDPSTNVATTVATLDSIPAVEVGD